MDTFTNTFTADFVVPIADLEIIQEVAKGLGGSIAIIVENNTKTTLEFYQDNESFGCGRIYPESAGISLTLPDEYKGKLVPELWNKVEQAKASQFPNKER